MLQWTKFKYGVLLYVIKRLLLIVDQNTSNSKTHKHEEKHGIVVTSYEFTKSKFYEIDYILEYVTNDCRDKFCNTFEPRYVYDINIKVLQKMKK